MTVRTGLGYDTHRLVEGRRLILGGVEIPSAAGLEGYSDADVLTHAVMDALLGAAALGDIGEHFPDDDPRFQGADSVALLAEVSESVRNEGYEIVNVDCMLLLEAPKIAPHKASMRSRLAGAMGIGEGDVNVKATTAERMGFVGRGEGASAFAVATIRRR